MVATPITSIGATYLSPTRTCHPYPTGYPQEACLWWSCFPECAQRNPTTTSNTASSKGVQVTKPYRPSYKVTFCTTATQFPRGTGATPYSRCHNNTTTRHFVHPIFQPMPGLGSVWNWDDGIRLSLHKALHSWQWKQPCIRNLANYLSIANSTKTHTTKRCGTAPILTNLVVCAKELVPVTKQVANKLQKPTHSTWFYTWTSLTTNEKRLSTQRWCVKYGRGKMTKIIPGSQSGET